MWARAIVVMFVVGCVAAGDAGRPTGAVRDDVTVNFHCLNHTSIHVVTCTGSISLFPITITIDSLRVLSDNEIEILDNDLDDLSVGDGDLVDDNQVLSGVESTVLNTFLDDYGIALDEAAVVVCTAVAGTQVCK